MDEGMGIYYADRTKELIDKLVVIHDTLESIPQDSCAPIVKEKINAIFEIIND